MPEVPQEKLRSYRRLRKREFERDSTRKEIAAQICVRRADTVQLRAQEIDEPAKIRIVMQRDPLRVYEVVGQRLRRAGGPIVGQDQCRVNYHCDFGFPSGWRGAVARFLMRRELDSGPVDSLSRLQRAAEQSHARSAQARRIG